MDSPINKKEYKRRPETTVIFKASSCLNFFFRSMIKGKAPRISMTEKRIRVTEKNSLKLIASI